MSEIHDKAREVALKTSNYQHKAYLANQAAANSPSDVLTEEEVLATAELVRAATDLSKSARDLARMVLGD